MTGACLVQDSTASAAVVSFLLVGPVEEFFKLLAVWIAIYRRPEFREPLDGIVYATTAALGFATVENILYLGHLGPQVIVARAVFATPAHVMFASMWGYAMGLARFKREGELRIITAGFLLAALFHGGYDFLVAIHPASARISLIPVMILMGWIISRMIRKFRTDFPFPPLGEGALIVCPNCGAYVLEQENACPRCGFDISPVEIDGPRFCARCRARVDPCRDTCQRCGAPLTPSPACQQFL